MAADHVGAHLQGLHLADVDAHGGVELQGAAAGGHFRVAVGHADLLTELVDEDDDAVGLGDAACQLPQRLAHQSRVKPHKALAHLALNFRTGHQSGHRVHYHQIHCAGAHQLFGDLQSLLAGVRLGDEHGVDVHTQRLGVGGIHSVFGVDIGHFAAHLLSLRHHMECQGGLAGGFRPVDFNDAPTRQAADAQRQVQGQGTGGDGVHLHIGSVAHAHDRTFAIRTLDLGDGSGQCFLLISGGSSGVCTVVFLCCCHKIPSSFSKIRFMCV